MIYRVVIQPGAERDIQQAARHVLARSRSPSAALRVARGIRAKLVALKSHPLSCPIDPDSDAYGSEARLLVFGRRPDRFRVVFTVKSRTVHVLAVTQPGLRGEADAIGVAP
ncbi:type II toxin-antitoxin system RelE/ParE family toxin [Tautonia sociabilis]|uniref:Type II toxin-antitoxin system RelE/ParE family toxin n=1 Tax=Tautonia sociabilis TaxID=2080755 RepID=A0A432MPS1_9BACT|nr:type II toxin-antitoxin system RelE/ParE family toxin [Tautonia sociabilis]RUL89473.1 hypothetical protein TsocGM_01485 [Tautonia sociabilis]